MTQLLVAGSIALDTLEGATGTIADELGGSALYFALAASLIVPVSLTAPVGEDAFVRVGELLDARRIDASLLSIVDAPTYRWQARQAHGRNFDLGSRDEIYDRWQPRLPADFDGWAFVGSMRPSLQSAIATELRTAQLLAGDAMHSYLAMETLEVEAVVSHCDWFFANEEEFSVLAGGLDPEAFRAQRSLEGLCVKAGPDGSTMYTAAGQMHMPALRQQRVVDPTGAGDALAGGFLARWLSLERRHEALLDALAHGAACASLAIEEIGLRGLARATPQVLEERVKALAL